MIHRVFEFSDAQVLEAMVPRNQVKALPVTVALEDARNAFISTGYSRLPVYGEHLDTLSACTYEPAELILVTAEVKSQFVSIERTSRIVDVTSIIHVETRARVYCNHSRKLVAVFGGHVGSRHFD